MTERRSRGHGIWTAVLFAVTLALCLAGTEFVSRKVEAARAEAMYEAEREFLANVSASSTAVPEAAKIYEMARGGKRYRYQPNVRQTIVVAGEPILWYTNSHGMRWRETTVAKPPGITRVAFLGDSMTAGSYVRDMTTSFQGIAESMLDRGRFEVLGFGVGGYGVHEMHEEIVQEVSRFDPDVIVLNFFNGNDFRDTYFGFDTTVTPDGALARVQAQSSEADGEPEPPDLHEGSNQAWVLDTLDRGVSLAAIYRYLKEHPAAYGNLPTLEPERPNRRNLAARDALHLASTHLDFVRLNIFGQYSYWARREPTPVAQEAIRETLGYLDRIREFCASRRIQFVLVAIPFREQVTTIHPHNDVYDIGMPQLHLEEWAKRSNVPYLDLLPTFRALDPDPAERTKYYVPGDGHWNTRGHAVGGRAIGEFLKPLIGADGGDHAGRGPLAEQLLDVSATARLATLAYFRLTTRDEPPANR